MLDKYILSYISTINQMEKTRCKKLNQTSTIFASTSKFGHCHVVCLPAQFEFLKGATMTTLERSSTDVGIGRWNIAARLLADKSPTAIAFLTPDRCITYGDLDKSVRQTASALVAVGIAAGDRVLLLLDDDLELVVLFLASLAIGAIPAILSPRQDEKNLVSIMDGSRPRAIFIGTGDETRMHVATKAAGLASAIIVIERFVGMTNPIGFPGAGADPTWSDFVEKDPEALSFLQYTSGSSGEPKGVMHASRAALEGCRMIGEALFGMDSNDIIYATSKTFFGFGQGASILFPLYAGASAILDPRWAQPHLVVENIKRFRPTMVFAVPSLYRRLLTEERSLFESARAVVASGASLPHHLKAAFEQRFGSRLYEGYGSTELFHLSAADYPESTPEGSLGRVLPDIQVEIRDAAGNPVEAGEIGELHVHSPARSIGYLGRDDLTAERFDHGWFATGDLFSRDECGFLYFKGRSDDRFKVYGRWVSPFEIESLVKHSCPNLVEAIVVPASEADGEIRPVLFTVEGKTDGIAIDTPYNIIAKRLERYKRPILHLQIAELPTNNNGKLCRQTLMAVAREALAN